MSVGKNYCSFFVQVTDELCYEARAITPNERSIGVCLGIKVLNFKLITKSEIYANN